MTQDGRALWRSGSVVTTVDGVLIHRPVSVIEADAMRSHDVDLQILTVRTAQRHLVEGQGHRQGQGTNGVITSSLTSTMGLAVSKPIW